MSEVRPALRSTRRVARLHVPEHRLPHGRDVHRADRDAAEGPRHLPFRPGARRARPVRNHHAGAQGPGHRAQLLQPPLGGCPRNGQACARLRGNTQKKRRRSVAFGDSAYTNKVLSESPLWIRRMASPKIRATESCVIFRQPSAFSRSGMVFVTTTSSIGDACSLSIAGPESTGCTAYATSLRAPDSERARAPSVSVPAVSI